jgi:hypothetical protein
MQTPLQIVFRHADRSPALEARVRDLVARLEHAHHHINACRVTVEGPPAHQHKGSPYCVRIALGVPGGEINVSNDQHGPEQADVYVALRDAFEGAKRQLLSFAS